MYYMQHTYGIQTCALCRYRYLHTLRLSQHQCLGTANQKLIRKGAFDYNIPIQTNFTAASITKTFKHESFVQQYRDHDIRLLSGCLSDY